MDDITPVTVTGASEAKAADTKKATPPAPGARKYSWAGITPRNPALFNLYGTLKLRPWSMTDDEIDAVIKVRPDLARLWKVAGTN